LINYVMVPPAFIARKRFGYAPFPTLPAAEEGREGSDGGNRVVPDAIKTGKVQEKFTLGCVFFPYGDPANRRIRRLKLTADHPTGRGQRGIYAGLVGVFAIAVAVHPAAARHAAPRHASHGTHESQHSKHESASAPPYAAIVLDANSGNVLHADKADELRHPASLTKIMTLYLLFERLEAGKIRLDSELAVSEHASMQAPTKLGLKPGQSIEVEDAIRGLVTKSANDAAVAVAEAIGGSEREFADMMTLKAHAIGMSHTIYRNASGLPNDEQVTTARDQALLGRAIAERFPRYYRYFATPSFTYHGQTMRNHNQLLSQVEGMDGIKTGYTQASGFNLVASVRRDSKHVVSVVMGGTSAGARDARMRGLIETYMVAAAPQKTMVAGVAGLKADAARREEARIPGTRHAIDATVPGTRAPDTRPPPYPPPLGGEGREGGAPTTYSVASASYGRPITPAVQPAATVTGLSAAATAAPTGAGSAPPAADPIKPIQVKTVKVKMAPAQIAALGPAPAAAAEHDASQDRVPPAPATSQAALLEEAKRELGRDLIAETIRETTPPESAARRTALPVPSVHSGWVIQVGAFDVEREARERLSVVQAKAGEKLKRASPFTEAVVIGEKTLYRARFAGVQKDQADAICRQLKRNDIVCLTIRN
jgi:D-alanyl-D-alanine carboxypeptidase